MSALGSSKKLGTWGCFRMISAFSIVCMAYSLLIWAMEEYWFEGNFGLPGPMAAAPYT